MVQMKITNKSSLVIERVQTGVRMEKRILKVLKALAEYNDMSLGDLLEGVVLHAFDGKTPFSAATLARIRDLKKVYDLDLDSSASHRLKERNHHTAGNTTAKRSAGREKKL
jgi:predicted DNA-binding ribbon-helix-helix protein